MSAPIDWANLSPAEFERAQARFQCESAAKIVAENEERARAEAEARRTGIDWLGMSDADFERAQASFHRDLDDKVRADKAERDQRAAEADLARRFPVEK
jgi:hypothetical protein